MEYIKKEIKKGIMFHGIETDKFKTNLIAIFLTVPLNRETVTLNSMIPSVLRRGSKNMISFDEICKSMEDMYGASFDCGVDKIGDNQVLKFYLESINDDFLPENEQSIFKETVSKLSEIIFNPYLENGIFKIEYVEQEKNNMKQRIESKIDNKALYAKNRCIEEMYKGKPAGLYKYGYVEDLDKINSEKLFNHYQKFLNECKIDVFVSGKVESQEILNTIINDANISKLQEREPKYIINSIDEKINQEEKIVEEKQDIQQGKVVIGCDIMFTKEDLNNKNIKYDALVYNSLLRAEVQHQNYFKM